MHTQLPPIPPLEEWDTLRAAWEDPLYRIFPDDEKGRVTVGVYNPPGAAKKVIMGVGKPISPEDAERVRREVFPPMQKDYPRHTLEISNDFVAPGHIEGIEAHIDVLARYHDVIFT